MPAGIKLAGKTGELISKATGSMLTNALGSTTGAGAEALRVAFEAGKRGSQEFLDNMRGNKSFEEVVDSARAALGSMRLQRQAAYKAGMVDIANDKTVLDFAPLDQALNNIMGAGKYKGVQIRQKAADTAEELQSLVEQWRALDPAEYHTPEGFDALKQAIGDIRDSTQHGTNARRIADQLYHAVRAQIDKQAPAYAKVMKEYQEASETLKEIERTFSLGDKAKTSRDTALRKFLSLMRNNAQTNYGNRLDVARKLQQGGHDVMPAVAGQALSSWTPRGLMGLWQAGGIPLASLATMNPAPLVALPFASPRLMGEVSYGLGRLASGAQSAIEPAQGALMRLLQTQGSGAAAVARTSPLIGLSSAPEVRQ